MAIDVRSVLAGPPSSSAHLVDRARYRGRRNRKVARARPAEDEAEPAPATGRPSYRSRDKTVDAVGRRAARQASSGA